MEQTVVVGHPRRHHLYQTALAYLEVGALARWVTEVFVASGGLAEGVHFARLFSKTAKKLCNYSFPALNSHVLVAQPTLLRATAFRCLGNRVIRSSWEDAVVSESDRAQAVVHLPCVHAEGVFKRISGADRTLVLEQYIADRRQGRELLIREAESLGVPDVEGLDSLGFSTDRISMNEEEYLLAHRIVAGSEFVRRTLITHGVPPDNVFVAEYGVDLERWQYIERRRERGQPLEVAFIGSGALRKGLLRLLRAAKATGNVYVHVFGNVGDLPGGVAPWANVALFHGHIPHSELPDAIRRCHVFALPSLWEGSAYVVAEAMASGLPVIVTPNAGSWARSGTDGFTVPVCDEIALAAALDSLLDEDRRIEMGRSARKNAELHDWSAYRVAVRRGVLGLGSETRS